MSQNRNHLVPTTITDKTGKQTTVYKKPATQSTSSTPLPKATLPTNTQNRQALEHDTAALLVHLNLGEPANATEAANRNTDYNKLLSILPQYSDEMLHRLNNTPTELSWEAAGKLAVALRENLSEEDINDWITIEPVTARSTKIDRLEHIVNSFVEYPHLEPQNNGHYPPRRAEQVRAIGRVTEYFRTTGEGFDEDMNRDSKLMQIIHDEHLREFITTHEDPTAVADIIIARNLTDPEQITLLLDIINQSVDAVKEGAL